MCVGMSKCAVQKLPNECAIKQYVVAGGSVRGWLPRPSLDHFRPTMDVQASSLPVGLGPSGACYVVLRALRVTGANEERWSILLVSWNRPNITPKRSNMKLPRTSPHVSRVHAPRRSVGRGVVWPHCLARCVNRPQERRGVEFVHVCPM